MTYLLVFFTSLITTIILTPFFIDFLKKTKIVDIPGGRKIHTEVIPRMGGLIIFLMVLVMLNAFIDDFESIKLILFSATLLVFSGIVDDVMGLENFIKFIIQNISGVILIFYLENHYTQVTLFGIIIPHPFEYLVLLVFIIGVVNSINFLDGLDGLASGFSLLIFTVLLILAIRKEDVLLMLILVSLIGSTLGFLRFNAFPASIFLGDTGSLILGFFLILLASLTSINYHDGVLDLTYVLILLAVPLIDTVKVFLIRIKRRRDPFSGDTNHQHHIIKSTIVSHEATVFLIEIFSLVFILISLLYLKDYRLEATVIFFIAGIGLIFFPTILRKLDIAERINVFLINAHDLPIKNLMKVIKVLLLLSGILMILISLFSFSVKTTLTQQELIFLLIMTIILLFIAIFQSKKVSSIGEINVFLNFSIFFIISKLSLPLVFSNKVTTQIIYSIVNIAFYVLTALLALIILFRWKALMTRKLFFTGIDLTMIVFMLLTFLVNNILKFDLNYFLSISLLQSFVFYIWYKLVIDINKKYILNLTLISFLLPIGFLLTLLVNSFK
ncbi:MAG: undecaprenyl/decaprenyl-phosphate alpha-N-acetylglucosaminyl 1-phosphate transferase [Ignavibacteriales bacterium]|nr:undecaprenyl/decaprenyl-phosphate alpha-N-acetylglucosaminyl 1-phosphate transferase [Ignavibacteriales bacterium]MBK7980666.1 undecaprenyl/decaprenyl-phosphate alpha-N-acetylglucosaminyl 1-phosphate transferase [Ignavibacteriota bacterium]